jgi:hypothetical protein
VGCDPIGKPPLEQDGKPAAVEQRGERRTGDARSDNDDVVRLAQHRRSLTVERVQRRMGRLAD